MTAQIAAYGRLVDDPQVKQTSKGTPMTLARMAVSLPCSQAQDGQATLWLSVIAFGKQADFLAKHQKGDVASVSGTMQVSQPHRAGLHQNFHAEIFRRWRGGFERDQDSGTATGRRLTAYRRGLKAPLVFYG